MHLPTFRYRAFIFPAVFYFAANVISIYALSHLRSYVFAVIMNFRIVIALLLSSLMIANKVVTSDHWRAVIIICCAATILCLDKEVPL